MYSLHTGDRAPLVFESFYEYSRCYTNTHTYFDNGLVMASTTGSTADSISADNIEYSSFNAHGLPKNAVCMGACGAKPRHGLTQ